MARAAYAALFLIALPVALWQWAARLDVLLNLPPYRAVWLGVPLVAGGVLLVGWAMRDLWIFGDGLPSSVHPPNRLVTTGIYGLVPHPIYVGSVGMAAGVSLLAGSAGGLWVVTPVLAAMTASWVIGFERDRTRDLFGAIPSPRLRLPPLSDDRPTVTDGIGIVVLVLVPWLIAFFAVEFLGVPRDARSTYFAWDEALPVVPWTEGIYSMTYVLGVVAPFLARTRRALRRFAVDGLVATAVIIPFYLLVPLTAEAKPVTGDGFWEAMLRAERVGDAAVTAFPSFHVVWTCVAARLLAARWPVARWPLVGVTLAVGVSCVTTGMHSAADVVAGFAAYGLVASRSGIWARVRRESERLANSWREVQLGPVRIASHGFYTGLGAAVGVGVAAWLAGPDAAWWIIALTLASVVGAAIWAQVIEGSPQLLRPYGYFGSVFTVLLLVWVAAARGADPWLLLAAMGTGGAFAQGIGRVRCLVHGCCHGREAPSHVGVCYRHPMTRVVRLGALGSVPIHPVQVYSLFSLLFVGAVLVRLWMVGAPLSFIAGAYLILTGLFRFAEEHYRGEPQTAVIRGMRLYQWLAIASLVMGAALTTVAAASAPQPAGFGPGFVIVLAGILAVTWFAYGGDFPGSNRRFSRLR